VKWSVIRGERAGNRAKGEKSSQNSSKREKGKRKTLLSDSPRYERVRGGKGGNEGLCEGKGKVKRGTGHNEKERLYYQK